LRPAVAGEPARAHDIVGKAALIDNQEANAIRQRSGKGRPDGIASLCRSRRKQRAGPATRTLRLHTSSIGRKAVRKQTTVQRLLGSSAAVPKLFQKSKYLRKKGFYFERRQIPEIYVKPWKV